MLARRLLFGNSVAASFRRLSSGRGSFGRARVPIPKNEPFLHYAPGSPERAALDVELRKMKSECPEIPLIIGGQRVKTGKIQTQVMPTNHAHALCTYHEVTEAASRQAIEAALAAKSQWEHMPFEDRAAVFLRAADLAATKYRARLTAASMLGAGKNVWQAEIDGAVEMCDFWRFGVQYAQDIYGMQPTEQPAHQWNRMEYRALEGFVVAVSPFNFVAIGANLASSPAIMGNVALWKPANTSLLANYIVYQILEEAGLPPGVINFLPGDGVVLGAVAFRHRDFAGLHFTGSTRTFNAIWREIAGSLDRYRGYPKIVGETGGKNFHFVHASADVDNVVNNTIRGAFEYRCARTWIKRCMFD